MLPEHTLTRVERRWHSGKQSTEPPCASDGEKLQLPGEKAPPGRAPPALEMTAPAHLGDGQQASPAGAAQPEPKGKCLIVRQEEKGGSELADTPLSWGAGRGDGQEHGPALQVDSGAAPSPAIRTSKRHTAPCSGKWHRR